MKNIPFRITEAEETNLLLKTEDLFLNSLSPFDREFRTRKPGASKSDFLAHLKNQGSGWIAGKKDLAETSMGKALRIIEPYARFLPESLILCGTTGLEEPGSAYCRGENIIVLTERAAVRSEESLTRLLVHELFHILSRNNPEIRKKLYNSIGFDITSPVRVAESLEVLRVTNPDASELTACFRAETSDGVFPLHPALISKSPFRAVEMDNISKHIELLFYHEETERGFLLEDILNYYASIGNNTGYIIHPEEILAENFVFLAYGEDVKTPSIIAGMDDIFTKAAEFPYK